MTPEEKQAIRELAARAPALGEAILRLLDDVQRLETGVASWMATAESWKATAEELGDKNVNKALAQRHKMREAALQRRLEAAETVAQNVIDFKGELFGVIKARWCEAVEQELAAWEKVKGEKP